MSTQILLATVEYGKPQSKYYAKASAGNAALAFDQEYQKNGVIKTVVPWDCAQPLLILHRQEGKKKKDIFHSVFTTLQLADLNTQFYTTSISSHAGGVALGMAMSICWSVGPPF